MSDRHVFETPWFKIAAKQEAGETEPYYVVECPDCVMLLAITDKHEVVMVRQFRPTLGKRVLEVPSGHIDRDEAPAIAAARELFEETGYEAQQLESLGSFYPDTGRLSNTVHVFFSNKLVKKGTGEAGIEVELVPLTMIRKFIDSGEIGHGQDMACLMLASLKNNIGPF